MVKTRSQAKLVDDSALPGTSVMPTSDGATSVVAQPSTTTRPPAPRSGNAQSPSPSVALICSERANTTARTHSSRSSATVRAHKLAAEAEIKRRHLERERQLAQLELEAEQTELAAKFAALEASSDRSKRSGSGRDSYTASWVRSATMTNAATRHVSDTCQAHRVNHAVPQQPKIDNAPIHRHSTEPISQLAEAIAGLARHPKKPDLVIFSGEITQWMAFKSSYDHTKAFFSPTENLARLNSAIRGVAYQSVASLLWTACEPEDIVRALEQNFARPELLVAREIADLRAHVKINTPDELNMLANKIRNFIVTIRQLNQTDYLHSPELFRCVALKLNEHTRARFTDFASSHSATNENMSKLELLSRFLLSEADRQLKFNYFIDFTSPQISRSLKKEVIHTTVSTNNNKAECTYCKQGTHAIKSCKHFLSLTTDQRWQWVRETKTCFRCLRSEPHKWNNCRAKRCGLNGCSRRHHHLLHGIPSDVTTPVSPPNTVATINPLVSVDESIETNVKPTNASNIVIATTGSPQSPLRPRGLLKVLPVVLEGPDGEYSTTALLDEGSTVTLIDGEVAARIGAKLENKESIVIQGVGGMAKTADVAFVNFYIRGRNLPNRHLIQNARAISPLGLRVETIPSFDLVGYHHLADLAGQLSLVESGHLSSPTVLIGAADWQLSLSREVRVGRKNEPVASRTLLGWVLHGAFSTSCKRLEVINHLNDDLDTLIKLQYEIDSIGISKRTLQHNSDDMRAIDMIDSSVHRLDDGRFEVRLPWKQELPKYIPDSYPQALSRFKALERQMARDSDFAAAFRNFIHDIIHKGYAEECDPSTYHKRLPTGSSYVSSNGEIRWYLPIFGVFHPQKKKIRAVHDAAAVTQGVSLNSLLLQGPDLLQPLLDILFRFREGAVALNADIKEMFPQIKISPKDRDAQRFLWRGDDGTIREYRMASMIFGAVSSPFIAQYLKNKNAKELETSYPSACRAVIHDHYMDDYLGSFLSVTEAASVAADIVKVHKNCGFEMRSWISNKPEALSRIPQELRNDPGFDTEVVLPANKEIGILGVRWNPFQDSLSFRSFPMAPSDKVTKRIVLSNVMKVFDPLGLLMPVTIWGRILVQRLWRQGIDWDSPLPEKYKVEYRDWSQQLQDTAAIRIPRWYMHRTDYTNAELHVFADGGEQAYSCVAYWRVTYNDGSISVRLIGSKARVAPLKPLSIPRLELQAALIATRFAQTIISSHHLKPSESVFWTDSTTVLKWIRSDARNFKPFVSHRLGEIAESTNPSNWRWIPTSLNVADDATKPKKLDFTGSHRWFSGPSFLLESKFCWPTESNGDVAESVFDSELKQEYVGVIVDVPLLYPPVPNAMRFSRWRRLLRATARALSGARMFRAKLARPVDANSKLFGPTDPNEPTSFSHLRAADLDLAEKLLLLHSQMESFPEEYKTLRASQPVPKGSRIANLAPQINQDGLLRLDTRIRTAPAVSESMKCPIILDGRHQVTRLFVLSYHEKMAHGFNETVLNELRQRYWVLKARSTIKSVVANCRQCRRFKGRVMIPQAGNLPIERLDHHTRPFTHTGLDYFGPVTVAVARRQEKRYVALYTCLVTRAVHLEIVSSLSSDAALMSLRRFIARRGSPSTIISDNGTNFVGASRELKSLFGDPVEEFVANQGIKWQFIPPASPFMGGTWERLVRTIKAALQATLGDKRNPREDVLATLLLEAEAVVNSRPLTYVPSSAEVPEAITPFHFLIGTSSNAPWTSRLTDTDLLRRSDWRRALRLADHFWARWLREYLPTLRPRGLQDVRDNFREGDVVLVVDSTMPRGLWPLGRVVKVSTGPDGRVRVVDVFTKGGTLRRPVRKLLLMEAESQPAATGV